MTAEPPIRVLTWTAIFLWGVVAASLLWNMVWFSLASMIVGLALSDKELVWLSIQIATLVLIPVVYFFIVRRLQWNLPPEGHIVDRINVKIS